MLGASPALLFPMHKTAHGPAQDHPLAMLGWMLLEVLLSLGIFVAVLRKIDDVAEQRNSLSLGEALVGGFKWFPAMIGGTLLYFLAVMCGMILLVIPGLIWMLSLSFFWFFILLDNQGPLEALKSSRALMRGNWWRWAAIYTVALIVFIGLYAVMALVAGLSSRAVAGGDISTGLLLANFITQVVVSSISAPFLYSVQLIGFHELQLRKGGTDLAARIAQAA
jgi:hypothetical protein